MKLSSQTKLRIVKAAQRQFGHFGFSKVTMDEIAEEVSMGKASLYYYFPTKEELFREVVSREHDEFTCRVKPILESPSLNASEKLHRYADARVEYFNKLLGLNIPDIKRSVSMSPMFVGMFQEFSDQELKFIRGMIQEGKQSGEFDVNSVEKVAKAVLHLLQGLRLSYIRRTYEFNSEPENINEFRRELLLVMQLFSNGLSSRKLKVSKKISSKQ